MYFNFMEFWNEENNEQQSLFNNQFIQGEVVNIISDKSPEDPNFSKGMVMDKIHLLTVRNMVLFPRVITSITVVKEASIRLTKKINDDNKFIGIVTHKNNSLDSPVADNIYKVGTIAKILKYFSMPDGNVTIFVQGISKFKIEEIYEKPTLSAKIIILPDITLPSSKKILNALTHSLKDTILKMLEITPDLPHEAILTIKNIENPIFLIYFLSSNVNISTKEKQSLLELDNGELQAKKLLEYIQKEIEFIELKNSIRKKTHLHLERQQKEIFLRQQVKVLQDELGEDQDMNDIEELKEKSKKKKWTLKAKEAFDKELRKMMNFPSNSIDYSMSLNYCDLLLQLPWLHYSNSKVHLDKIHRVLNQQHYGLKQVKERIVEYLAVLQLRKELKSPILCLLGPPGVGKTSLGSSVARALKRRYVRIALGGLRDEAELRGHRKTYIGAMPGRIIQSISKAGVSNPVFIFDEVDKVGNDFRGDPASALLEILDPEQNSHFSDYYLEVEYDLSKVFFICTANSLSTIHPALLDRMEIIEMNSYTTEEKKNIASKHLIPQLRKEHGLNVTQITFSTETIEEIIIYYTQEAGVRNLKQKLAKIMRKRAKEIVLKQSFEKKIQINDLKKYIGIKEFELDKLEEDLVPGVSIGMAWTSVGGEILFIESTLTKGTGKLILSGQLGDVMKESATAAQTYIKSRAGEWNIDPILFDKKDLHVHVPAGAVPKDGPSAGLSIATSMFSTYTNKKIKPIAITGEITLRGKILPVGGIKEKVLAAKRAGIKMILLPQRNKKDVEEIEKDYIEGVTFEYTNSLPHAIGFLFDI